MRRDGISRVTLSGLLALTLLVTFQRAVSTVYVSNFQLGGPDGSVLLLAFLVTGWTIPGLPVLWRDRKRVTATFVVYVGGVVLSLAHAPLIAHLGALVTLTAGTPLLIGTVQRLEERVAVSCALGVVLFIALRAWFDTLPAYATPTGRMLLVGVAVAALTLWVSRVQQSFGSLEQLTVSPVPITAYVWLAAMYFGSPAAMANWTGLPYPPVTAATIGGLLVGSVVVVRRGRPGVWATAGLIVVFVASAVSMLIVDGVSASVFTTYLTVVGVFTAHLTAVVLLVRGGGDWPGSIRTEATGVVLLQLAGLLLLFLHVAALNWAYMPEPVADLVAGRLSYFLLGVWLLLPAVVTLALLRRLITGETGLADEAAIDGCGMSTRADDEDRGVPTMAPTDRQLDRRTVLGSTAASLLGLGGVGFHESHPDRSTTNPDGISVMSYNIRQFLEPDGDYSHEAIRDVIAAQNPDIVGLQESDSGRVTSGTHDGVRWLAHQLGYQYTFGTATSAGTYGVALLSRWPIANERVVFLPVGNSHPYPALVAELDTPAGTLPVVVAHFQVKVDGHRQPAEAERLVEFATEYDRLIAMGDFNARPGAAEAYRILDETFHNAWTVADTGDTHGYTYSATNPRIRIDHIWYTDDWTVSDASIAGTPAASDHLAVVATLNDR